MFHNCFSIYVKEYLDLFWNVDRVYSIEIFFEVISTKFSEITISHQKILLTLLIYNIFIISIIILAIIIICGIIYCIERGD